MGWIRLTPAGRRVVRRPAGAEREWRGFMAAAPKNGVLGGAASRDHAWAADSRVRGVLLPEASVGVGHAGAGTGGAPRESVAGREHG
jgi:hypothetical protein